MNKCKNCPRYFSCYTNSDNFSEEENRCNFCNHVSYNSNDLNDLNLDQTEEAELDNFWEEMSYRRYIGTIMDYNFDEYNNGSWNRE